MKNPHPYAEILRAIADGEAIQWQNAAGEWCEQGSSITLFEIREESFAAARYRIKPRTIRIGDVDVPEPMREAPKDETKYWVPDVNYAEFCAPDLWRGFSDDLLRFERGLCYSNEADAEIAGRAIAALFIKN